MFTVVLQACRARAPGRRRRLSLRATARSPGGPAPSHARHSTPGFRWLSAVARAALAICAMTLAAPAGHAASPLTLSEAQDIAETNQPVLSGQRAGVRAAEEAAVAAGQLPDPKLQLGLLNVPVTGPDAFSLTRDFMTMRMVGVMQEFPREAKRKLRAELAGIDGQQRQQELAFTRRAIRRDTAMAWIDVWYAQRNVELVQALQRETERQIESLAIAVRSAKAVPAEVLAARIELDLARDRGDAQKQRAETARAELSRWIGDAAQRPLPADPPSLPQPAALESLVDRLQAHPHLSALDKQVSMAEKEAELAKKGGLPDWNLQVGYAFRGAAYSDMMSVQVGVDLPLFQKNRQLRDFSSKLALAERARAMRQDNLREMQAMMRRVYAEWASASERAQRYRSSTLPQAAARTEVALAAYRAGRGDLARVLEARRMEIDLRVQQLMLEADIARGQAQIAYYQEE
jgi:outer membrane protein TolC